MKKSKKIKITKKIERVLLTEVLPYETPLIFSNRYFYDLCCNKPEIFREKVICNFFPDENHNTIPFNFSISRVGKDPRILSIIHPCKQREIVEFYKENKEIMLYYASQSPFSIRKPIKIGRYYFDSNDKELAEHNKQDDESDVEDRIEISGEEGINFKNFFSYYRYGSIHKFYESYQFQECEKSFSYLYRFDISKCFDSIYTHSIQWAIHSKEIVKRDIRKANQSFVGKLDKLMQSLNYNETHGIVIGPEFSRIFAEIILQRIDRNVYNALIEEKIFPNTDYKLFRYVDDHFLFFNDEKVRSRILDLYTLKLREYKMSINQAKTHQYSRPIITEISIAKQKIQAYINDHVFPKQEKQKQQKGEKDNVRDTHQINANRTITNIKIILKESGAEYEGVANYLLAIFDSKIQNKGKPYLENNIKNILEIWDIVLFLFSVNVSVSSIEKITKISKNLLLLGESLLPNEASRVADKIFFGLEKIIRNTHVLDKELYLLITLREQQIFNDRKINNSIFKDIIENKNEINYFQIITILFYIRNEEEYKETKEALMSKIWAKCQQMTTQFKDIFMSSEACLLFFDLLSCPYLEKQHKLDILKQYDIKDSGEQREIFEIIKRQETWFTKWKHFDLLEELEYKKSSETYT